MKKVYNLSIYLLNHRVIKYLFSGGIAAVVDLGLLFIFVQIFNIWYLLSAILAFLIAFCVSFMMQKFLTFAEHSRERIPTQLKLYLAVAVSNLCINTLFMYVQVDIMGIHYLAAQIFASGIIAMYSFFIYKNFIFHHK